MGVSRRGASVRAPRVCLRVRCAIDRRRRLRRRDGEASRRFGRSRLRRSAVQPAAPGRPQAPRQFSRRRRRRRLGQVRQLRRLRRLHARLAARLPPRDEAVRHPVGDRLLSQHFPRRHAAAGSRLLDPQRRGVAQDQSDAEFPRPPLHQCARDADLGGARGRTPRATRSTTKRSRPATRTCRCDPIGRSRCAPARSG